MKELHSEVSMSSACGHCNAVITDQRENFRVQPETNNLLDNAGCHDVIFATIALPPLHRRHRPHRGGHPHRHRFLEAVDRALSKAHGSMSRNQGAVALTVGSILRGQS